MLYLWFGFWHRWPCDTIWVLLSIKNVSISLTILKEATSKLNEFLWLQVATYKPLFDLWAIAG